MDATIITTIGELIQDTRRSLDMTITQLSELSSVPRGTISRIENGEVKRPEFPTARLLTTALKIPFETLVDYYVENEKRSDLLFDILQATIQRKCSTELIRKVAAKYLESPNEDSLELTEKLYQHIGSIEDNPIKLSLYNLIIDYSRSHGIMPYIAKGMYQQYLIERNDFSKLKETYYNGKYVLHYIDYLTQDKKIELYYKLGVHALNLRLYRESIEHCKKILTEDGGSSSYRVHAIGVLRDSYFAIGEYKEAELYALQYKQFYYLNPQTRENIVLMDALFAAKKGNTEQAVEQLLSFLKDCSDVSAILATNQLLQLYLQQNNLECAKTVLERSKINTPVANKGNPFIYSKYADYLKIQGKYYLAAGDYEKSISCMMEGASYYSKVNDTVKEKECLGVITQIHLEHRLSPQPTFEKLNQYFNVIQNENEMEG